MSRRQVGQPLPERVLVQQLESYVLGEARGRRFQVGPVVGLGQPQSGTILFLGCWRQPQSDIGRPPQEPAEPR